MIGHFDLVRLFSGELNEPAVNDLESCIGFRMVANICSKSLDLRLGFIDFYFKKVL